MHKLISFLVTFVLLFVSIGGFINQSFASDINFEDLTQGEMIVIIGSEEEEDKDDFIIDDSKKIVSLPLKHTSVVGEISGFVARTTVIQEFVNPYSKPIEAIYNFPLPNEASVDSMVMKIGKREIIGKIEKKEKAEKMYEQAKEAGKTTSLLNQERPNIFTQKVANILPGDNIKIEISYFQVLKYDSGKYSYVFPMVVGPRYNPESVKDAENITSPTISKGNREGHTIDVSLKINSGVAIKGLESISHDIDVKKISDSEAEVSLKSKNEIPNKDFIFNYKVASDIPQVGILTYKDKESDHGYFTIIAEPQKSPEKSEIRNKEIIFVLDTSGSMSGRPIVSLKKAMEKAISDLGENDYFNVYSFNSGLTKMFPDAQKADSYSKDKGLKFVQGISAGGGTVMDQPLKEALKEEGDSSDRMRIILILTDGDVGNEAELVKLVKNNIGQNRIFTLGIDYAPNRYLLDRLSEAGNGKTTYILPDQDIDEKVDEFYETFKSPVLTDIKLDFDGLTTYDILPTKYSDLYAGQPLYIYGKYSTKSSKTKTIKIKGIRGNDEYVQNIVMDFPSENKENSALASLWARKKIKDIYSENYFEKNKKLEDDITQLGLDYSIMTEYTSFIAIDDNIRNESGNNDIINVPKYQVEGKDYSSSVNFGNNYNTGRSRGLSVKSSGPSLHGIDSSMSFGVTGMSTSGDNHSSSSFGNVLYNYLGYVIGFLYLIVIIIFLIKFIRTIIIYIKEDVLEEKQKLKKRLLKIFFYSLLIFFIIFLLSNVIIYLINLVTIG